MQRTRYTHDVTGDVKTVTTQLYDGADWIDQDLQYFRYYNDYADGKGYPGALKLIVGHQAYKNLQADGYDPLTASDDVLKDYADEYFEYAGSERVTRHVLDAGTREYTLDYQFRSTSPDYNQWETRIAETRPDGAQNIYYTNHIGQIVLKEFRSGGDRWIEYRQYDGDANLVLDAMPSAVQGYTGGTGDDDLDVTLKTADGLIYLYDYYGDEASSSGESCWGPEGYKQYDKIQHGSQGAEITLRLYCYTERSLTDGNGVTTTVYPLASVTEYRGDDGTGPITTSFQYTWHTDTVQILEQTTTLPVVSADQNGPGTSATRTERFDTRGRLVWSKDERGFLTHHEYDPATGAMVRTIQDVDTTQVDDEPAGWTTPSGGGLHLVTDHEIDNQGRTTQTLGPEHDVDGTTVRTASWTVYQDADREVWTAGGYAVPNGSSSSSGEGDEYTYTLVNPVSISKQDYAGRTVESIQATRGSGVTDPGKLLPTDVFAQTAYIRWNTSSYDLAGQLEHNRAYHTIPTSGEGTSAANYDQADYGYDALGRQNRTKTPGGTISRTVYDARGQQTAAYLGTDDTGATDADPTGSGAGGNNMLLVAESQYDGGDDGGDGNLTRSIAHVDSSHSRATQFTYDWRNRQETVDGEIDFFAKSTYDNLNRVTKAERYDTTANGNLIARSETAYDDRGQVYQTKTYAVDPSDGSVGNSLVSNTWYDAAGNAIKQHPAGSSAFTKTVYDGLGRPVKTYVGYDTGETSYADAGTVTGDTLFEQSETTYDEAGNVTFVTARQRLHDATGTGELTTPSGSQPKARCSYTAFWYDEIGRQTAAADYGTNGGTPPTRPDSAPASSDTVLVATAEYNARAEGYKTTDPAGRDDRAVFDDAGRVTKTIQNYVDGTASAESPDEDVTVETTYNPDGQVLTLTAVNPTTGDQVTKYVYGTDIGGITPEIHRNDLLRAEIYPDSDDTTTLGDGVDEVYDRIEFQYNRQGDLIEKKVQNGTGHALSYDALGRLTEDEVTTFGDSVDDRVLSIARTYEVRGMPETVTSYGGNFSITP